MTEKDFSIELTEMQKDFIGFAWFPIMALTQDKDNPLTQALYKSIGQAKGERMLTEFMKKYESSTKKGFFSKNFTWTIQAADTLVFYVFLDLIMHVYRSEYFIRVIRIIEELERQGKEPDEYWEGWRKITLHEVGKIIKNHTHLRAHKQIGVYAWDSERFPDPILGLPAQPEIPELPREPKQLKFSDYDHDGKIVYTYKFRKEPANWIKDLNCLTSLFVILSEEENRPAKIITAYFPNLHTEIGDFIKKTSELYKKQNTIPMTEGECGLLYACSDLFGRFNASSYRETLSELEERSMYISLPKTGSMMQGDPEGFMRVTTILAEKSLKEMNKKFGNFAVIKAYRAIADEMIWFDE